MIRQTLLCSRCGSENIRKNGKDRHGQQKYHCKECNAYRTLGPSRRANEGQKEQALKMYQERSSFRGVGRGFGVHHRTVSEWLKKSPKPS